MPDPSSRATPLAEAIAAYREALLRHAPAEELAQLAAALDPEIVAWLDLFQASRQETIHPDPAFVRRLDRIIATVPGPKPAPSPLGSLKPLRLIHSHAANGRRQQMSAQTTIPARPHGPWHTAWPQSAARLAAAVLLMALLFGSAWTALYPLGLWDREALPLFIAEPAVGQFEFLWASTGGPESLVHPYGVAVDADGNVWVSDGKNDRFQIFAPDGTFLEAWGSSGSSDGQFDFHATYGNPSYDYGDVAFDADGNIYVADTGNFRVQKFAPDRSFLQAWGSEGRGDGQLLAPGGIAIGPSGTVFVADEGRSDVPMFTADGTFLGTIGRPGSGDGEFLTPAGVAVDSGGDVWVADFSLNRIQRFSASGEFIAAWGETGEKDGQLHGPNDVVVDRFGHVFVAETHNNRLQVLSEDGRFLATIGEFGTEEPGQFYNSLGVAIDADGVIYVSDNRRLQAFRLILPQGATLVVDQTTLSN